MNEEQALVEPGEMTDGFVELNKNLDNLLNSGVSLVVIQSDEPYEVIKGVRAYCYAEATALNVWNSYKGLRKIDMKENKSMDFGDTIPGTKPIGGAITYIEEEDITKGEQSTSGSHIYLFNWCHWDMKKSPVFIQALADLSQTFTEINKNIILVVPNSFEIIDELKNNIVITHFNLPTKEEVNRITDAVLERFTEASRSSDLLEDNESITYEAEEKDLINNNLMGMTRFIAETSLFRAIMDHKKLLPNIPVENLCQSLSSIRTEIIKKSEILELMKPEDINNIGGLDNLKSYISDRKRAFTQEAKEFGVKNPKGIMLVGPPGCGKSASAKAVASVLNLDLIRFDVSRVFSGIVGSTEARIKTCLKTVEAMAPCALLIDEIDKVFNINSGGGDSGVGSRVLGAILTFMQESDAPIYWVLTANRIEGLPPELLRKGRLDDIFFVGLPNDKEREEVLKIHLRKGKQDHESIDNLALAVEKSENYVSSEIESAVNEAIMKAFNSDSEVTGDLIAEAIESSIPLSVQFEEQFSSMSQWAENNAKHASKNAVKLKTTKRRKKSTKTTGKRNIAIAKNSNSNEVSSTDDLAG